MNTIEIPKEVKLRFGSEGKKIRFKKIDYFIHEKGIVGITYGFLKDRTIVTLLFVKNGMVNYDIIPYKNDKTLKKDIENFINR